MSEGKLTVIPKKQVPTNEIPDEDDESPHEISWLRIILWCLLVAIAIIILLLIHGHGGRTPLGGPWAILLSTKDPAVRGTYAIQQESVRDLARDAS